MYFLIQGIITGFLIAVPIGPIAILCIRRTLYFGRLAGLMSGLGAAVADTCYGAVAAYGITSISTLLIGHQFWLGLVGGIFLLFLGFKTFFAQKSPDIQQKRVVGFFGDFLSTLFLTLSNPMTILAFIALFAGQDLAHLCNNFYCATVLAVGVFCGSLLWWFFLVLIIGALRTRLANSSLKIINKIAGIVIILFAVFILASVLKR